MRTLWIGLLLVAAGPVVAQAPVADFELPDARGVRHRLGDWSDRQVVAVIFLGTECPLARRYGPRLADMARRFGPRGVAFVGIDSNQHDSLADIGRYVRAHQIPFPVLKDAGHIVADRFGAARNPEVFLLDHRRVVRYRGRIDDQYAGGVHRPAPRRADLAVAIEELLAGRPVSRPTTEVFGCVIDRAGPAAPAGAVTYSRDVARVLQRHCVVCHRPGQVAPFALTTYAQAAAWADTIPEVVEDGRMPPWHADPRHGRFANDPRLHEHEKATLADWARTGCPEGDPADLPPAPPFPDGWSIPPPDLVVTMPQPFTVPADGTVEYQYVEVDPGFNEDRWVRAAEIRPGNRRVVHHCTVFLVPPGQRDPAAPGRLGSYCLAAMAPGAPPLELPAGMAKRVPAGWRFLFVLHYTPVGSVQTDRTSLGLVFADPRTVRHEVATHLVYDSDFIIPPHAGDVRVEKTWQAPEDVLLLALFPHMHLRGRSFRYEANYPDGRHEVLLDVPRYDFNWEHRYVLAEPKRLPAGTTVCCVAHYDNSAANPVNPDPSATVRAGPQSTDEMFNGYFEWTPADQDLTRHSPTAALVAAAQTLFRPVMAYVAVPAGLAFLAFRRCRRPKQSAEC